ncbi:MAG: glycoside hydrolase family 9 protein [Ignavibacteriaceae bacterium]|nr:glycoside hydrolase family 9 protein [Ignavibacteriaceae bacterium]
MNLLNKYLFHLLLLCSIFSSYTYSGGGNNIYIRANQVGYLPRDIKTAVIMCEKSIPVAKFEIKNTINDKIVFSGSLKKLDRSYGKFIYCYSADFSWLSTAGNYKIVAGGFSSHLFRIKNSIYNNVADSLMLFFKEQRCGPTNPILHAKCHLSDASRLIGDANYSGPVDVTGGWHDASDYVKFLSTTAYTTYMLIFSYDFDKTKFSFDNDKDGIPDVLAEAKVGLDWLLRCNYSKYKLVTQVQDLRDHSVGFRMPENDTLRFDRPAFAGIGKNQIGIYTAALALASRVWAEKFKNPDFAKQCLAAAENLYSIRNKVPDIDTSGTGTYRDNTYWGKLALGAVELYLTTKKQNYLSDAMVYADSARSDYWWSWGNINSLADYRLAKINTRYSTYILNNLIAFNVEKDSSAFNEGLAYTWGTTNSLLGAALQAILYKNLTGTNHYDSLAVDQRDYVLGRNPWGISFIYNTGTVFTKHFHSQIAFLNGGYLPGALSAGPAPESLLKNYKIINSNHKYDLFNTDFVKYYDDTSNYITNEPTISSNATALFVYGYYSDRR